MKEYLNKYIKHISNEKLIICVEDHLNWLESGNHKYKQTILDEINELYFDNKINKSDLYRIITEEISERVYKKEI